MKTKLGVLILFLAAALAPAQTNNLTALLQQGLFEEQANRNLDAAISNYQSLATRFDQDRSLAATAIFRLGECYRAQGRTNEATAQYQRILREFPDQQTLATLSRQNLTGMGIGPAPATASENGNAQLWDRVKNLPQDQLEKVLTTLMPDAALTQLEQQRDDAETKLAELREDYNTNNLGVVREEAVLRTVNRQISERVQGMMQALKLRAEVSRTPAAASTPANDEDQEIRRIQEMIQNSPDLINAPDEHGHTPLEKAAINGWLKVAAFLLDHGTDENAGKISALNQAANAGNRAMVEFLLSRGADINAKAWQGETPLHTAVERGYQAVTEVLLANKADVNTRDDSGETPLASAARQNQPKILQMLLAAGAEVNTEDDSGRTPLSFAASTGSPEILKMLLAAKADPNAGKLDAPLLCAIDKNDLTSAELLLQADADPNVDGLMHCPQGSYGSRWYSEYSAILRKATPLWLAIQKHQLPTVQLLLKYKANPDDSQISEPPVVIFWALSETNILEALLDGGANPNVMNPNDRTPLSIAAENGSLEAVKLLLAAKADPNAGKLDAPLLVAIHQQDAATAELLLQAGANPNAKGEDDWEPPAPGSFGGSMSHGWNTPLSLATFMDQLPMVQLLLKFKADPNDTQVDGSSLLFHTLSRTNLLEALLDAGANVDPVNPAPANAPSNGWPPQWTPLLAAANRNNAPAVEILLKHGANPNARDLNGDTPLHEAEYALANSRVFELLLANGSNPNLRDNYGKTPLDLLKDRMANDVPPEQKALVGQLVDLLRQHGALDVLPDWNRISVSRPSARYSAAIFSRGTNDWNQFTLFDLLGVQYDLLTTSTDGRPPNGAARSRVAPYGFDISGAENSLAFPDFTWIIIHRPSARGTNWSDLKINLARALDSGDCAADVPLRFGDVVEIPEADHVIDEPWKGLSTNQLFALINCLTRHLQVTVNGQTTNLIVAPRVEEIRPGNFRYIPHDLMMPASGTLEPEFSLLKDEPFMLWPVLENSKLLLASSDLSRVTVKRRDTATGKAHEWTVDCSNPNLPPNFWLRDGDVIEVPEKP